MSNLIQFENKAIISSTVILLTSGASCTWAHHAIVGGERAEPIIVMIITLILAVCFTALQAFEYINAGFTISDSVFGSTFFMATGFHGFHVLVGSIFLLVCLTFIHDLPNQMPTSNL